MSSLRFLLLTWCLGSLHTSVVRAQVQSVAATTQTPAPYQVSLEDESGNKLRTFAHRGQLFAMGEHGQRYNVRITNNSARRVEAVISVDGRDVMSGQPGDYKTQRGYVLPARSSVVIEGFRTSLTQVAAFRFTAPSDSYSSRMGTPENVGVIGAAFFGEQVKAPTLVMPRGTVGANDMGALRGSSGAAQASAEPERAKPSAKSASSAVARESSADRASNIGTQYGEQQDSQVVETTFVRARPARPDRIVVLRYDDQAGLEARGIRTRPRPKPAQVYASPNPFPVSNRFAPPPPAANQ